MSHTHFLFHIIFATEGRLPMIGSWEPELHKYLAGIIKNHSGEAIEIGGMPDHAHILTRLTLKTSFPDFMRELKAGSSRWVRIDYLPTFGWQRKIWGIHRQRIRFGRSAGIYSFPKRTPL